MISITNWVLTATATAWFDHERFFEFQALPNQPSILELSLPVAAAA